MKIFKTLNRNGFGHVEAFVFILVIAFVALGGIYVSKHNNSHAAPNANGTGSRTYTPPTLAQAREKLKNSKIGPIKKIPVSHIPAAENTKLNKAYAGSANTGQLAYSSIWSGYVATPNVINRFNTVIGYMKVPSIDCSKVSDGESVFWVGFDGWTNSTVEQDGISALCIINGSGQIVPWYDGWWETYPTNSIQQFGIDINAGDTIQMEVQYVFGGFYFTVNDTTNGQKGSSFANCGTGQSCQRLNAEWIAERPQFNGVPFNLLDFGTTGFAFDQANDGKGNQVIGSFPNTPIDMIGNSGNVITNVSPTLTLGNSGFNDTWLAAN